jgi:5-methylthioadenosine/S-adenosylhomocysteine deaminase
MKPSIDLLIENGLIVTMDDADRVIEDGAVAIREAEIIDVGTTSELHARYAAKAEIDAGEHIVMPGLINAHSHLAMTLFRGFADDLPLDPFLARVWEAEGRFIHPDTVTIGTRLAFAEMIRGGTTMALDMYWFPEASADVASETGFRLINGPIFVDFDGPDGIPAAERAPRGREFFQRYAENPFVLPCVLPHGTYTVSPDILRQAWELVVEYEALFHTHASETAGEVSTVRERYGMTPPQHLDHLGLLSPRTSLAHCVHLSDDDIRLIAERGAAAVHCPISNLKMGSGIAPLPKMHAAGIPIVLGTDGAATGNDLDMWKQMRLAAILHRGVNHDPTFNSAENVVACATRQAAAALGIGDRFGSLAAGKYADLILIDLGSEHLVPMYDVFSHLVYAVGREDVSTVIIHGRLVMRQRELLTIDEAETVARTRELAAGYAEAMPLP